MEAKRRFSIEVGSDGDTEVYYVCQLCNSRFEVAGRHYVSRTKGMTGLAVLSKNEEATLYDTYDCPYCGCQNRIQERMRTDHGAFIPDFIPDEEDCDGED